MPFKTVISIQLKIKRFVNSNVGLVNSCSNFEATYIVIFVEMNDAKAQKMCHFSSTNCYFMSFIEPTISTRMLLISALQSSAAVVSC